MRAANALILVVGHDITKIRVCDIPFQDCSLSCFSQAAPVTALVRKRSYREPCKGGTRFSLSQWKWLPEGRATFHSGHIENFRNTGFTLMRQTGLCRQIKLLLIMAATEIRFGQRRRVLCTVRSRSPAITFGSRSSCQPFPMEQTSRITKHLSSTGNIPWDQNENPRFPPLPIPFQKQWIRSKGPEFCAMALGCLDRAGVMRVCGCLRAGVSP